MTQTDDRDRRSRLTDTFLGYSWLLQERWLRRGLDETDPSDRRLLILVSSFPPDISGGVYRPAAMVRYARSNGWQPTVVTWAAPGSCSSAGLALREYVGRDVVVLQTSNPPVEPAYRLYPTVDGSMIRAVEMARVARKHFGRHLPGTIFCSGPSFSPFVAGWLLARGTDRKLVLEYRDEWTLCPFAFVSKTQQDIAWERRCLSRANLVITMTPSQREALLAHFARDLTLPTVEVVPNGWEPAFQQAGPEATQRLTSTSGRAVIMFAGKLGDYTHPARFLQSLETVLQRRTDLARRLEVRFLGMKDASAAAALAQCRLPGVVQSLDPVPQAVAGAMMRESQALLLIHGPDFERYVPGKIYEYAASGVPILLLDDIGESSRIVRDLGLGYSIRSDDLPSLEEALDGICTGDARTRLDDPAFLTARRAWLDRHRRESLATATYEILARLR